MSEGKKPKYHLINDLPHIYELEDMIRFCEKFTGMGKTKNIY